MTMDDVPADGRKPLPLLSEAQREATRPELLDVIEYRKSGLSVNWIIGCPLDCGYCVRHLFDNFELKVPRALMREDEAAALLLNHPYFRSHITPIQLLNRATDPMLPPVKPHLRHASGAGSPRVDQPRAGDHAVADRAG